MSKNHRLLNYFDHIQQAATDVCSFVEQASWNRTMVVGLASMICAAIVHAAPVTVRFAPEQNYGPFVYQAPDGSVRGLSVDLLRVIARQGDLTVVDMPPRPLADILDLARRGEVELVSSLRPTTERATYLDFSRAYVDVPAVLLVRDEAAAPADLASSSGRKVAVGEGYAVQRFVIEKYPAVQWIAVKDDVEGLQALEAGRVAGVVLDVASSRFIQRERSLKGLRVAAPVGFNYELSFAYPKGRSDIGESLERGMRAMPADARSGILARWLGASMTTIKDPRKERVQHAALVIAALALLLCVAGWGLSLRKRWRSRTP